MESPSPNTYVTLRYHIYKHFKNTHLSTQHLQEETKYHPHFTDLAKATKLAFARSEINAN